MNRYLHIGGIVAVAFDSTESYLLTITHSGRGVFRTDTWERVARDYELAYPEDSIGIGIGPIEGQPLPVTGMNFNTGEMLLVSPSGRYVLECESSGISITDNVERND
jgi:hypothetical protein